MEQEGERERERFADDYGLYKETLFI